MQNVLRFVRCERERWREARKQFSRIGDELTPTTFRNRKLKTRSKRTTTTTTRNNRSATQRTKQALPMIEDDLEQEDEVVTGTEGQSKGQADAYPLTVQNAVFTASLGTRVEFQKLVKVFYGVLGKETFPAVICRFLYPEAVVSFFESGQVVVTGSRHPYDVVALLWMIALRFRTHLCAPCVVQDISINNVNCSASVGYNLDLELFHIDHVNITSYAPDVFPGLKFPINDIVIQRQFFGVTFLLFRSGRMVVTGAKVPSDAQRAFTKMQHVLRNYDASKPYRVLEPSIREQVARRKHKKNKI